MRFLLNLFVSPPMARMFQLVWTGIMAFIILVRRSLFARILVKWTTIIRQAVQTGS